MSTIPFPNIADEAGQIAAALRNALEEYTRVAGLKAQNAALQQRTQQEAQSFPIAQQQAQAALQQTQQQNQIQQLQLQDQQTLRKIQPNHVQKDANGVPTGYDFDGFFRDAVASGVSPQTLQAMQEKHQEILQKALTLDDTKLKAEQAKNQRLFEKAESLRPLKGPEREAAYQQILMDEGRSGADVSKWPARAPNDDALTALEAPLGMHAQVLADAKTQSEIAKNLREGTASQLEAKYLGIQEKLGLKQPVTAEEKAWARGYEKNKTMVPVANFNLQNAGVTGSAGQPSAIAQALANNEMKWSEAVSPRMPIAVKQKLLAEVKQINPNYNSGDFAVEQGVKKAFTSGQYSQQLNSINRAREHMGTFLQMADAMNNGDVKAINRVKNVFKTQFGSDAPGNLNIAKQAFASEVGKAFAGSSVALADRQELAHSIDSASSWDQLSGAAKTADALLEGAQKALKQTYESGMKSMPNFGGQHSSGGGMVTMKAPNGATRQVPADQVEHYKSLGATVAP